MEIYPASAVGGGGLDRRTAVDGDCNGWPQSKDGGGWYGNGGNVQSTTVDGKRQQILIATHLVNATTTWMTTLQRRQGVVVDDGIENVAALRW